MTGGLVHHMRSSETRPLTISPGPRALIADDQADVLTALRLLLRNAGYQTESASSPEEVLEAIKHDNFDLVLMDLNYARDTTSGQEGLDLITNIRRLDSALPIVVLTAWGSVELAVEAMHRGGRDFVLKPWDNSQLLKSLNAHIEDGRRQRLQRSLDAESRTANDKLQQELEESHQIQAALIPKALPDVEGLDLAMEWRPARAVGGDYVDVLKFSDRHTAFCIADVAGKGLPAALLMSNVQAVLKSFAGDAVAPAELCTKVNRVICENIVPYRFITCFYALLDTQTRKLSYTNAGHCPPMLIRDGVCLRLNEGGSVLGVFPDGHYTQGEIQLQSGDSLVLFTDGITEAENPDGRDFGEDRLRELLTGGTKPSAADLRDRIMEAVSEFSEGEVYDDATLMVVTIV